MQIWDAVGKPQHTPGVQSRSQPLVFRDIIRMEWSSWLRDRSRPGGGWFYILRKERAWNLRHTEGSEQNLY